VSKSVTPIGFLATWRDGKSEGIRILGGVSTMTGAALSYFRLDIVSDTICPWCYVGKRRLAAALHILEAEGLAFDVTWRPFQLNPTMPREGLDRRAYRSAKFGSWEKSQALDAQVIEAGASAGLVFVTT
jgi:predicted DsbA family dithiol-disulfide isomerase